MMSFLIVFCLLSFFILSSTSYESFVLRDLFNDTSGILAGFGDYNADKRVDVFVISHQGQRVDVWLANMDGQFDKITIIETISDTHDALSFISGIYLTDFNGDGFLDVLCLAKSSFTSLVVYWGSEEGLTQHTQLDAQILDEPVLFEYNGDGLPDLLVEITNGTQYVLVSLHNRTFIEVRFHSQGQLTIPHSSAYVNITSSVNTDLLLTLQEGVFHIYGDNDFSNYSKSYETPSKDQTGQSSFGDLNQDGLIDHIIPIGRQIQVYSNGTWHILFELPTAFEFDYSNNVSLKKGATFNVPPTLIVGDYDSDGYPDILTIVKAYELHMPLLLRNIPCYSDRNCKQYGRSLEDQKLSSVQGNVHLAAFYDYMEDGSLDILLWTTIVNSSNIQPKLFLLKSVISSDTCFLKVTVTSGLLEKFPLSDKKPYGVNVPGPSVFYETIKTSGEELKSSATQLTQSAHFALQLPFVLFGLGQTPNFIETVVVALPHKHGGNQRSKTWTQIVPNSQVIVNPYTLDNPLTWTMQLFVIPSKQIYTTAAILGSTCLGLIFIVGGLLWKESKDDKAEKKQESHRFNFDAM